MGAKTRSIRIVNILWNVENCGPGVRVKIYRYSYLCSEFRGYLYFSRTTLGIGKRRAYFLRARMV